MFKSVIIDRYRGIKYLEIKNLSRINLLVGKNNTGKTSILEAISILAFNELLAKNSYPGFTFEKIRALFGWVYKLSFDRNYEDFTSHYHQGRDPVELNREVILTIMNGRDPKLFDGFFLKATTDNKSNFEETFFSEAVSFLIGAEYDKTYQQYNPNTGESKILQGKGIASTAQELAQENVPLNSVRETFQYYRSSISEGNGAGLPLGYDFNQDKLLSERLYSNLNMQYIKTNTLSTSSNPLLYDNIVFDQIKLNQVINSLNIIEPEIEKFAYQANEFGERSARVKLRSSEKPLPITAMGDGINRILAIILAIVNCQGGYLLIDEFENGLHYSVQKQLWSIIFQLAHQFDIQIFATTHSNDTIHSFAEVLATYQDSALLGKALRLQRTSDAIIAIDYNQKELSTSTEFDIEIR